MINSFKIIVYIFLIQSIFCRDNKIFWDGSNWNEINKKGISDLNHLFHIKNAYLNGLLDGRYYFYLKTWSKNIDLSNEVFGDKVDYLSTRELIKNLDHFYSDPTNGYIPIPSAIIIANLYGQRIPLELIDEYIKDSKDWINSIMIELDTLNYSKLIEEKYLKYSEILP